MKKFIDDIIESYQTNKIEDTLNTCIITPNRRAHRFIKETLKKNTTTSHFLPQIFSIDDFIFKHIPLLKIDEADLTYILFEIFNQKEKHHNLDFDEFLTYASVLIHDFNEIDMQLANGKDIFSYLNDAKAIQQWNPDGSPLSPSQKEYLKFYNHLAIIYQEFRAKLLNKKYCYQGMGYRYFAENIDNIADNLPWKQLVFAGFNALTNSEEKIIKHFSKSADTLLIWDADKYYLEDHMNEAGMYLRKYKPWSKEIGEQAKQHFIQHNKSIDIIGSPGILGQVRMAAQIVETEKLSSPDFENNTVIVPADENLLIPLLNSLSSNTLEHTNITMGFPIQHSQAYRLAESIIKLHLHSSQLNKLNNKSSIFHKNDFTEVCNNDLLLSISSKLPISINDIRQTFLSETAIATIISQYQIEAITMVFKNTENQPKLLLNQLIDLFSLLLKPKENDDEKEIAINEQDALAQILKVFTRLKLLIDKHNKPESIQGFYVLYKQLIQGLSQSFTGNIDKGIQLMGLLETRLMDFENVIILSTNEDILPASSFSNSFIPNDIKFEFGLPGIQEKTAVYAYHFYRLIQRAKKTSLIYSTTKKKMSGGERSRFIKQIEFELKQYNKQINIKHKLLDFGKLKSNFPQEIIIEKDDSIMKRLEQIAQTGLSPTRINNYIRCPLMFYFKTIARIKEVEQAEDMINPRLFGDAIHQILEDFYKPYVNKYFPYEKLDAFYKNIPQLVQDYFKTHFKGKIDEGLNYLSIKDIQHYLQQFIKYEMTLAKKDNKSLHIKSVEESLQRSIVLDKGLKILIKGKADRIDEIEGVTRILDYKTGSVDPKKVKIPKRKEDDKINKIFTSSDYDKATQLFLYDWMYKNKSEGKTSAGIISFRAIKSPYIMLTSEADEQETEQDFKQFLSNLFDSDTPFEQTENTDICKNCDYKNICLRT